MNFLMHLHFSCSEPELLVGNLMGDFVKGRLEDRFSPGIRRGIELHRKIDAFAATNEVFRASRQRLDPSFGHYRGVLVDLFYDHFLAMSWDDYADVPFPVFMRHASRTLTVYEAVLPEQLRRLLPAIFTELLPSYVDVAGIDRALSRMAGRIRRPNPLPSGGRELRLNYEGLRKDFHLFHRQLAIFVESVCAGTERSGSRSG
ncbi:MAG TPA: ACP phosphodiesterase [Geobacteraceae bacterium]